MFIVARKYNKYNYRLDAGTILREIVECGFSEGWQGDYEGDLKEMEAILNPFNVKYTDDMRGRWELG